MTNHPRPSTPAQPTHTQHDPAPAPGAPDVDGWPPVRRWLVVPGFTRRTVLPLTGFVAALAAVTVAARHWQALVCVVAVLPVAVVIQWALSIHRASLAGAPVHPVAVHTATAVMGVVTLAMAALVVTVAVHPAVLPHLDAFLRGGIR